MWITHNGARIACAAVVLAVVNSTVPGATAADEKTYVMKISLPTINETVHQYSKAMAARVEKETNGRIKTEVYPASQLGAIPRQIEGTQFGSIQCVVLPPEFFVGIDERFELLSAPGLANSMKNAEGIAHDPEVQKLILGLGANKGLYGAGLFATLPSYVIAKSPVRHLADLKGKKLRILASEFQQRAFERLGVTPVAMTLGDVLPAIQQGTIDGAISGITNFTSMHYNDAAKYVTTTGQPYIFIVAELSRKWLDTLPKDLQEQVKKSVAAESDAMDPVSEEWLAKSRKDWVDMGGELIDLPAEEQASMIATMSSVAEDVSKNKPGLADAYKIVADAAKRTR
jgi:TRAP-type C4-dicarboxylate transport system substrate-binding protein